MQLKSPKKPISLRIDTDLLEWFQKQMPRGYQTYMLSVLREYVDSAKKKKIHAAGRAQEIYKKYYTQCFWHYDKNLIIDTENFHLVIEGLKKYGGKEGLILAQELCQ